MSPQRTREPGQAVTNRPGREIESKTARLQEQREPVNRSAEAMLLHEQPPAALDYEFDVSAWFACDQNADDESREPCIAECWYG